MLTDKPVKTSADKATTARPAGPGPDMDSLITYFEGQFVPLREAKVSIMTHAFMYGTASTVLPTSFSRQRARLATRWTFQQSQPPTSATQQRPRLPWTPGSVPSGSTLASQVPRSQSACHPARTRPSAPRSSSRPQET